MNRYQHIDLKYLSKFAIQAAQRAGDYLSTRQFSEVEILHKEDANSKASELFTEIDLQCQKIILEALQPTIQSYDIGILAEESASESNRLDKEVFWVIDPLDGTLPFLDRISGYAISIALVNSNGAPLIGVVYEPILSTLYTAIEGQGAFRNGAPLSFEKTSLSQSFLHWHMDRSFLSSDSFVAWRSQMKKVATEMGYKGVHIHSASGAVMHAIGVVESNHGCYFKVPKIKSGGGSIWDFAATALIVKEAGGIVVNFEGSSLYLNDPTTTFMNCQGVLFASSVALKEYILSHYRSL
ncbi:hypothetical protein K4L44_03120 [Halosquirtibacter laminarini]|uniref:Uncharacterized protein n=1 Tax=Halosquirtibacter laminarini TaxID=3374600 RepID=A0AC61NLI9_9BACT|nr:hypothetical protein K4L44_03120 [Prolixibacteraceae bacterium]